jgi:hypothetical protein
MLENATTAGTNRGRAGIQEAAGPDFNAPPTQNSQAESQPRLKLLSFKPHIKNSLRGFAEFELPSGLRLIDCPVLVSNDKAWVSLPSKPILDREGRQKTDANGKLAYVPVVAWRDHDLQNRFSVAAVDLIRCAHPQALDGSGV